MHKWSPKWSPKMTRVGLLTVISLLAGCNPPGQVTAQIPAPTSVSIGATRLAADLNLAVTERGQYRATLCNSANTVMIYSSPRGQVFVNGQAVGRSGGVFYEQGEMYVPASMEAHIRQSLRPVTVTAYRPASPQMIRPQPHMPGLARLDRGRVLIDPGHGGKDPGTRSVHGVAEKTIVLDVGLKLAHDLRQSGVDAMMTRNDDTFVELDERAAMSNRNHVDLFVAVHADSAPRSSACGFTVYISENAGHRAHAAAMAIEHALQAAGFSGQGIRRKNYRVIYKNDMPAVLVELGYLSNYEEAARLGDPAHRSTYAMAIAEGVLNYLRANP